MEDLLDTLLFGDEHSPKERSSIQEWLDDDPDLARAWAHWRAARRRLRDRLQEHLSDRRLLVLYVLDEEGETDALTSAEQEALNGARDEIARAIESIPALEQVVERIRAERTDFEAVWAAHVEAEEDLLSEEAADATQQEPDGRTDRAPRSPRSRVSSSTRRWSRRLAVAALAIGLAVAAVWFWPRGGPSTTVTVADGDVQVKTMSEGATVRLVGPATLSYTTNGPQAPVRRVTLQEGRAYFDVQHRPDDASFVVETPTATATVMGTQFGVTTQSDTTKVVLATGSVRVDAADDGEVEPVVLEPGEQSWVAGGEGPASPTPVDLTAALDWTGLFVFRSVPLETIAERLSQRYEVQVSVAGSLAEEPVTGTFKRGQPVQEILSALTATLGAEVQQKGANRYRLTPAP